MDHKREFEIIAQTVEFTEYVCNLLVDYCDSRYEIDNHLNNAVAHAAFMLPAYNENLLLECISKVIKSDTMI